MNYEVTLEVLHLNVIMCPESCPHLCPGACGPSDGRGPAAGVREMSPFEDGGQFRHSKGW